MTTEQFYEKIGGDFADTLSRLMTEERILRFVRKFPADESFGLLKDALARKSQEEAFRAAHTLKGVAQNLGFTTLYEKSSAVTEILRGGSLEVDALMPELESIYRLTVDSISALD